MARYRSVIAEMIAEMGGGRRSRSQGQEGIQCNVKLHVDECRIWSVAQFKDNGCLFT